MECDETIESYHRDYLINIDMVDFYPEELVERDVRNERMLNLNSKSHAEVFCKTCDQILNMTDVENQLKTSFERNNRSRIE